MIRLGHIEYSNCVPVHAKLLSSEAPADVSVLRGVPSALNQALARGEIDAAPCSSIEYARHAAEYRLLPWTIASRGEVQSILFECALPPEQLDGRVVALPSASATSVVLLRILLERRWGVQPRYHSFEQTADDPFAGTSAADAALWIGDVALRRVPRSPHHVFDLGREWYEWAGLPFAFALWQVRDELPAPQLERLGALLAESRAWFLQHRDELAAEYGARYGLGAPRLQRYWDSLVYDFSSDVQQGLLHYLALAAELGEAPAVRELRLAP